jgi:ribosomal protein S18 acetylase RimI-like enzyme
MEKDKKIEIIKQHSYDSNLADDYDELLASLHLTESFRHSPEDIQNVCESKTSNLYIGLLGKRAVAMSTLIKPFDSFGHKTARIEDFAVSREFRRQGIATTMLQFIINEAVSLDADRIELNSSSARAEAHKLYLANGFSFIDTNLMRKII